MLFAFITSVWWIVGVFFLISQAFLCISAYFPYLFCIYFICILVMMLSFYLARITIVEINGNLRLVSPTDGVITEINDRWQLYKQDGILLVIQSSIWDEWSKVSPIDGIITYIRYHEDGANKSQILIMKIQGQYLHTLHVILRSSWSTSLFGLQNNLHVNCIVRKGQLLVVAPGAQIVWFIKTDSYKTDISQGYKLRKATHIPLTLQPIGINSDVK